MHFIKLPSGEFVNLGQLHRAWVGESAGGPTVRADVGGPELAEYRGDDATELLGRLTELADLDARDLASAAAFRAGDLI